MRYWVIATFAMLTGACIGIWHEEKIDDARVAPGPVSTASQPVVPQPVALPNVPPGQWMSLFDGRSLNGWRALTDKAFEHHGEVRVENGTIILERGKLQTGVGWAGEFPRDNYEVSLEAMRIDGYDFFCGMTFPVGDSPCTLIVGGWGGTVVGLSNVDGMAAAENMTTSSKSFEENRWYSIRLRVTPLKIEAWIDDERLIEMEREDHKFSVWWEQEPARPFGVANWDTGSALRNIRLRRLAE
jgi:hypothetical protein